MKLERFRGIFEFSCSSKWPKPKYLGGLGGAFGGPNNVSPSHLRSFGQHFAAEGMPVPAKAGFSVLFALNGNTASASARIGIPILGTNNSTVSNKAVACCDASGSKSRLVTMYRGSSLSCFQKTMPTKIRAIQEIEGMAPHFGHPTYRRTAWAKRSR